MKDNLIECFDDGYKFELHNWTSDNTNLNPDMLDKTSEERIKFLMEDCMKHEVSDERLETLHNWFMVCSQLLREHAIAVERVQEIRKNA